MRKLLAALVVSFTVTLAACADVDSGEPAQFSADAVVVDVRTPAEHADGHLDDALNIDFNAPDFREKVAELDKDAEYVLYCRSGNRSGQAKAIMDEMGFTNVTNAGAYDDLR